MDELILTNENKQNTNPYVIDYSNYSLENISAQSWGTFFIKDFTPCKTLTFAIYNKKSKNISCITYTVNLDETSLDEATINVNDFVRKMCARNGVSYESLGWISSEPIYINGMKILPRDAYKDWCEAHGREVADFFPYYDINLFNDKI